MAKSLTQQLKEAKQKIQRLEAELKTVTDDRQLYRNWMVQDLKGMIELTGKDAYRSAESWVITIAKRLTEVKYFYW